MKHLGIKTVTNPDYIEFHVSGEITKERFVEISQGISQASIEQNQHCILVVYPDQSVGEQLNFFDQHKFVVVDASRIRQESYNKGAKPAKIAVHVRPEALEKHRFLQNTLSNRGVAIQHFDDREKALEWLL